MDPAGHQPARGQMAGDRRIRAREITNAGDHERDTGNHQCASGKPRQPVTLPGERQRPQLIEREPERQRTDEQHRWTATE